MPHYRSCLKIQLGYESDPLPFASCPKLLISPHVHFPPTPSLTSTHIADSPRTYDRAPISISPNLCALPERGGRVYTPASEHRNHKQGEGCYFQSRAYEACTVEFPDTNISTPLPELSLESDESDSQPITPLDLNPMIPPIAHLIYHTQNQTRLSRTHSQETIDNALSFLPFPLKQMDENGRKKTSCSSMSRIGARVSLRNIKSSDAFEAPALDGCLGGF